MGGFYRISEWIMRLSAINLLWIICSFPVFFLILSMMMTPADQLTADYFKQLFLLVGIVSPFTLVPASAAMFGVARKWVMGDEDVPLWKTYWKNYRDNYKQAMIGSLAFTIIGVVLSVNYTFYMGQSGILRSLSIMFIVLMVFLLGAFLNFLSILVHLHMGTFQIVKNSVLITVGQPINTIMLLVMNGVIGYISFTVLNGFLIVFFTGSVMAIASFWNFQRSFTRIQSRYMASQETESGDSEEADDADEPDEANEDGGDDREEDERLALGDGADLPDSTGGKPRE